MLYSGKEQATKGHDPRVNNELGPVKVSVGAKIGFWTIMFFGSFFFLASVWWMISRKNTLNKMQIKINESASGIDVQLQKRFDTLTKLVDSVKNHVKFNSEVFANIAALRSGNQNSKSSKELATKSKMIDSLARSINFSMEAYPQLGADNSVAKLMNEITMIEREIASSRRLYNSYVTSFNQLIYTFPTSVIAAGKKYEGVPLFATEEEYRKDVKIDF